MRPVKAVIIGAGNVAWSLAPALQKAGVRIAQVWSAGEAHAADLAAIVGARPVSGTLADIAPDADIYIISVRDDAVASTAAALSGLNPRALWVHTAGSIPLSALSPLGERRAVIYPLQTFTRGRVVDFASVPLLCEGVPEAFALARRLSDTVIEADSERRAQVHIAAVFACNFTCRLWALAADMLPPGCTFAMLEPLISETLTKATAIGPRAAQTGPAARRDTALIYRQQASLSGLPAEIYALITRSIMGTDDSATS